MLCPPKALNAVMLAAASYIQKWLLPNERSVLYVDDRAVYLKQQWKYAVSTLGLKENEKKAQILCFDGPISRSSACFGLNNVSIAFGSSVRILASPNLQHVWMQDLTKPKFVL